MKRPNSPPWGRGCPIVPPYLTTACGPRSVRGSVKGKGPGSTAASASCPQSAPFGRGIADPIAIPIAPSHHPDHRATTTVVPNKAKEDQLAVSRSVRGVTRRCIPSLSYPSAVRANSTRPPVSSALSPLSSLFPCQAILGHDESAAIWSVAAVNHLSKGHFPAHGRPAPQVWVVGRL